MARHRPHCTMSSAQRQLLDVPSPPRALDQENRRGQAPLIEGRNDGASRANAGLMAWRPA